MERLMRARCISGIRMVRCERPKIDKPAAEAFTAENTAVGVEVRLVIRASMTEATWRQ
jgi:hypothetical protein